MWIYDLCAFTFTVIAGILHSFPSLSALPINLWVHNPPPPSFLSIPAPFFLICMLTKYQVNLFFCPSVSFSIFYPSVSTVSGTRHSWLICSLWLNNFSLQEHESLSFAGYISLSPSLLTSLSLFSNLWLHTINLPPTTSLLAYSLCM